MKLDVLRERHGARIVTGATATPIANSVSEAYVMQRYLRPDVLRTSGLTDFDSWAASFGQHVTEVEMAPEGGGNYRTATRFAQFLNVPEMLRMWHTSADIKTAEDLKLPRPDLAPRKDGQRQPSVVPIPASSTLSNYVTTLGERAEAVRGRGVPPDVDNMLKISGDGRAAALDLRLVGLSADDETSLVHIPTKLETAAAKIHDIWQQHRTTEYHLPGTTTPSPKPGALQLVFCDLGTPGPGKEWSVYEDLKDKLTTAGMDPSRIRFIHEAKNDPEKARLFEQCRSGDVDVIIGSTQRMGVGTNIQTRAIAAHHLDCPWRPADVAQRDGRVLRQGNQNPEVQIHRYVVEGSFDAYMWQAVERKAKFIGQVMKGDLDSREIDDVGDAALSFNEVKAIASGDPRILDLAKAQQQLVGLERLERAHARTQTHIRHDIERLEGESRHLESLIPRITTAIDKRHTTAGDAFICRVEGTRHTSRADAAEHLRRTVTTGLGTVGPDRHTSRTHRDAVTIGGITFDLNYTSTLGTTKATATYTDLPVAGVDVIKDHLTEGNHGLVTRLENAVTRLDQHLTDKQRQLDTNRANITDLRDQLGTPFPRKQELDQCRTRVNTLLQQMNPEPPPETTPHPPLVTPEQQREINRRGADRARAELNELRSLSPDTPNHPTRPPAQNHPQPPLPCSGVDPVWWTS